MLGHDGCELCPARPITAAHDRGGDGGLSVRALAREVSLPPVPSGASGAAPSATDTAQSPPGNRTAGTVSRPFSRCVRTSVLIPGRFRPDLADAARDRPSGRCPSGRNGPSARGDRACHPPIPR